MKVKKKDEDRDHKPTGEVFLTKAAVRNIHRLLEEEGKSPAEFGLRLRVKGGGCSGLMLDMDWDQPREDDLVFEKDGARLIVDGKSLEYVNGARLTYVSALQGAGFNLINPNETGSCGCGVSFSV